MAKTITRKIPRPVSVDEVIALVEEPVRACVGLTDIEIESVAPLADGPKGAMVFCRKTGEAGAALIAGSAASLVVAAIDTPFVARDSKCVLLVDNPARWFIKAVAGLFPAAEASIHPTAVIEAGAHIGNGCSIGPGVFIGACVTVGDNCDIGPNCSLGASGLAIEREDDGAPVPYPHIGDVIVEDGVSIGAGSVVVRGILEDTRIGAGAQIGNMVNIGHNCVIAENCWISTGAVLCGSVTLGRAAMVGAGATVNNHATIGNGAVVGIGSVVTKSVADGRRVFGVPAKPLATMRPL